MALYSNSKEIATAVQILSSCLTLKSSCSHAIQQVVLRSSTITVQLDGSRADSKKQKQNTLQRTRSNLSLISYSVFQVKDGLLDLCSCLR